LPAHRAGTTQNTYTFYHTITPQQRRDTESAEPRSQVRQSSWSQTGP
jgi:hypothetical protein